MRAEALDQFKGSPIIDENGETIGVLLADEVRQCVHAHCSEEAENFVRFEAGAYGSYCVPHTELVRRAFEIRSVRPLTPKERNSPLAEIE